MVRDEGQRSRRSAYAVGAVLAVVLVAALGGWLATRGDDGEPSAQDSNSPSGSATSSATVETTSASASPSGGASTLPTETPTTPVASEPVTDPPKPIRTRLGEPAPLGNKVTVQVTDIESVKGTAKGPGEIAGPALRLTVEVTNDTAGPLDLDLAILVVYYGPDDTPAGELSGPGARVLPQKLAAGKSANGTYVFAVPQEARSRIRADFSYTVEAPTVIFTGPAS